MSHNNLKLTKDGICREAPSKSEAQKALKAKMVAMDKAFVPSPMQLTAQTPVRLVMGRPVEEEKFTMTDEEFWAEPDMSEDD